MDATRLWFGAIVCLMSASGTLGAQGNAPVISSLEPDSRPAGSSGISLIVRGTNFRSDATVLWNGSPRTTGTVTGGLRATITAADLAQAGTAKVTVAQRVGRQARVSEPVDFTITASSTPPHYTPTIATLSPATVSQGSGSFTLTVTGSNYLSGASTVRWNGDSLATTYVSSTQLRASVAAARISSAGEVAVTVRTRSGESVRISAPKSLVINPTVTTITAVAVQLAQPTQPSRLGEERLTEYGQFAGLAADRVTKLDCDDLGSSRVMVGIRGKQGWAIDELAVACQQVGAGGVLGTTTRWTGRWDVLDSGGNPFPPVLCTQGWVVSSVEVRVDFGQLRNITLRCRRLTTSGLTTGGEETLTSVGGNVGSTMGPVSCSQGRPARALRLSANRFYNKTPLQELFAPWIVAGLQMICEQPVVP
jgi:hypothetical protein